MRYYPVFLDLHGRPAVVIGGGNVAERKVMTLLASGARVTVVSPKLTRKLTLLAQAGALKHHRRRWRSEDLKEPFLIIAATDDPKANALIGRRAGGHRRLINVVDDPSLCNVIAPSIVTRGDLIIAISTSGRSPALAKRVREELERTIGAEYGKLLKLLAQVREQVQERMPSMARRRRILNRLAASDILKLLRKGKKAQALRRVRAIVGLKGLTLKV